MNRSLQSALGLGLQLLGIGVAFSVALPSPAHALPYIFEVTKEAPAGDLIAITGQQFGTAPEVWVDRIENASDVPNPELRLSDIVSASDQHITATLPSGTDPALYAVFVCSRSGSQPCDLATQLSAHAWVNRAEPFATLDAAGDEVSTAKPFRLYGWNMWHPGATPTVDFIDETTRAAVRVNGRSLHTYGLEVSIAGVSNLQVGRRYEIHVSNGHGGDAGRVKGPVVTLRAPTSTSTTSPIRELPAWAYKFQPFVSRVINVTPPTSTTAGAARARVQQAIDQAAQGGGVVALAAGNYDVGVGVVLKPNVILKGALSSTGARLSMVFGNARDTSSAPTSPRGPLDAVIRAATGASAVGVRDLNVETRTSGPTWAVNLSQASYAFLISSNVTGTNTYGGALIAESSQSLVVQQNKVTQIALLKHDENPIILRLGKYLVVTNNTFHFFRNRLDMAGSSDVQFESNIIQHQVGNDSDLPPNQIVSRGGIFYAGQRYAFMNNQFVKQGTGSFTTAPHSDGECLMIDSSPQPGFGRVGAAGLRQLTDYSKSWTQDLKGTTVTITRGRGAGQTRHVESNSANTLFLDRDWTLQPDTSSYYAVNTSSEKILIYANQARDQWSGGIGVWQRAVHDYIVAGNMLTNAGGVRIVTGLVSQYSSYAVATNVLIRDNAVIRDKTTPDSFYAQYWIHHAGSAEQGTGIFAPMLRGNSLSVTPQNQRDLYDTESFAIQGDHFASYVESPPILGAVLDRNGTVSVLRPYVLNQGAVQTVIRPARSLASALLFSESRPERSSGTVVDDMPLKLPLNGVSSGRTADLSRFAAPATLYGNVTPVAGTRGGALAFDGAGDYVGVPYGTQFANLRSFTVAGWVRVNAKGGSQTILSTRHGGDATFDLKVVNDTIQCNVGDGTQWVSTGVTIGPNDTGSNGRGGNIPANEWHHVAYVVDNDYKQYNLYLDGDWKRSVPFPSTANPLFMRPGQTLTLGSNNNGVYENLNGSLDEVVVYSRALSGVEVLRLVDETVLRLPMDTAAVVSPTTPPETPDTSPYGERVWLMGSATTTTGIRGGGITFDGNDHMALNYSPQFANLSSFTVAGWVRLDAKTGSHTILSTRHGGDGNFDMKVFQDTIYGDIGDGRQLFTAAIIGPNDTGSNGQGGNISLNEWHHIAYVVDNDTKSVRMYLNGDLKRTVTFPPQYTPQFAQYGRTITLGSVNNGVHENLIGRLDEVVVVGRAITTAEVQRLAAR